MPEYSLHLLALKPGYTIPTFLSTIHSNSITPLVQAQVLRWIILPQKQSTVPLLAHNVRWDLLLVVERTVVLPTQATSQVTASWTAEISLHPNDVKDYATKNAKLLEASKRSPPPTSGDSEMTTELRDWLSHRPSAQQTHPISMLNLLAFNPGRREQYRQYGQAFGQAITPKLGNSRKFMGNVIGGQGREEGWEEVLLVHNHSLGHFAAMSGDPEFLAINKKFRLGTLKDTAILCVMDVGGDGKPLGQSTSRL
ncbi:hypothetical protein P152DRAFT_456703 [Eremomyces bilateralis CBS 781.70]|uniref:Uncharacterized protein n=1 Tax=Eremomyces bilateralis CBS 781.70 TaxID=1392243 RepID=A0A6G1G8P7_9PEZI|nr:uncharacterized protein P152DRAFT_456703 [Eremomyces bilateralis CBS 781.70]KAF1814447.1 hypothetical protein P152DRAFT_456703 [Eremomyces bilateralis CBS 781.70]